MRVKLVRSGGFAGLSESLAVVDTARLDAASAQRLSRALDEVGFFELPARADEASGADLFTFEILVEDGRRRHAVAFPERGPTATRLAGLLDLVRSLC